MEILRVRPSAQMRNRAYIGDRPQAQISPGLIGQFVESERAATEVEDIIVGRDATFEIEGHSVEAQLPLFLDFQQARLAHDAQVLGHVVLRNIQPLRDFIHAQRIFVQETQDAKPGFFAQGFERSDAIESRHAVESRWSALRRQARCGTAVASGWVNNSQRFGGWKKSAPLAWVLRRNTLSAAQA